MRSTADWAAVAALAAVTLLSLTPLVRYPFAFHDDLVVPYYESCERVVSVLGKMGRPGLGLTFCVNAKLFPGFDRTHRARLASLGLAALSAAGVALFAMREKIARLESAMLSLLVFSSVASVMQVFYLASAGQVYGNLSAVLAALCAQQAYAIDPRRRRFGYAGFLFASLFFGVAAYGFYQLSGVLYFVFALLPPLAAIDRDDGGRPLARGLFYFAIGLATLLAYGVAFWMFQGELHWSGRQFDPSQWLAGIRLERLAYALFAQPWGIVPRVFAPWSMVGGPIEFPFPVFVGVFVAANLGIVLKIVDKVEGSPSRKVVAALFWLPLSMAILALLYSPQIFSGSYVTTYRSLFPVQAFVVLVTFVGTIMLFDRFARRIYAVRLWALVVVVVAALNFHAARSVLAEPARAEFDYIEESVARSIEAGAAGLPVRMVVPELADSQPHDEYGHLSSYYTTWGNRDAQVLVNLARTKLGLPMLPPWMFSFSVGANGDQPRRTEWVIDLYPLLETGMYFKHAPR